MSNHYSEHVVEIEHYLRSVAAAVRRKGRALLEEYGITAPQFEALVVLEREGDLTIGELSNKLYLAYSTTTDLVDRLEKSGYVERKRCSNDRRVVWVQLQPKGANLFEAVLNARRTYLNNIMAAVDLNARKQILDSLELLHMNMATQ
ncbi:MarR family winged helix-turn-helix transcriptional regulator [Alicyclobacillus dauci]|uniref:MarR family transcriptional regulator n=1 Tax=Alicyclobacillus dauci TaxID=1475485 RepID=A0ABY6Z7S2_9BACL|nr:MarR family transcriptional regulator [Alicyclobacillus dauci]WAH38937.1 MarR family transcriptional regulator [Alicyclobacillus dauci]